MSRHAGQPRLSDQAITDQARACAEEIRVMSNCPCFKGTCIHPAGHHCSHINERARLLGRTLALLEIMAGEK